MISEQLKFFLAKYLRSKSGGDYTEIELWIQPNPALAPGSPPSNIWSFPSFDRYSFSPYPDIEDDHHDFVKWKADPLKVRPCGGFSRLFFLPNQEINSPRLPGECDAIFCDLDIPIPHMAGMHGSDLPILSVFTTWCQVSTGPRLSPHTTPLESKSVKLPSPSSDDFSKAHLESYIDPPPLH